MNKAYKIVRSFTLGQKTKLLGKAEGKLLEIGSGTGELLANCEKEGWECLGVEPEEVARKAAFQNHGLKLMTSIDDLSLKENSLDRIMLWHVLEHVPNLHQAIVKFKSWLKKTVCCLSLFQTINLGMQSIIKKTGQPTTCLDTFTILTKEA